MLLNKYTLILILIFIGAGCSPFKVADVLSPYSGYEVTADVPYGTHERQKLDIYTPTKKQKSTDIIIFIYGGSWKSGEKSNYRFIAQPFTKAGFVTIVPNYRLYPEVRFPEFNKDVAKAVAWVHQNFSRSKDSKNIILVGHSAGAHIAALISLNPNYLEAEGLSPSIIKSWVSLAGPLAFDPLKTKSTRPIFETSKDDIKQAQPVTFADRNSPPVLLIHGKEDKTVYEKNSLLMSMALKKNGNRVIQKSIEGLGHLGILLAIAKPKLFGVDIIKEIKGSISEFNAS